MRFCLTFLLTTCFTLLFGQSAFEFVPNKGQFHKNALYKADIPSGAVYLEKDGLTFSFYDAAYFHNLHHGEKADTLNFHAYKLKFKGARKAQISLKKQNPGVLNYYLGEDESKWVSGLTAGGEVYYSNIYKNIDFRIYSKNDELKYDFIVHPGGKVDDIELVFEGLDYLGLRGDDLVMTTSIGTLKDTKPIGFQNEQEIPMNFKLEENKVKFQIDDYNEQQDLVIDPTLVFSTYSGSFANNFGFTATYDELGNLYAGGSVFSGGYPTTVGAYDITFSSSTLWGWEAGIIWGVSDIGITKYSDDGRTRLYSTYIGGNRCEVPHSLIVNNRDELFVLGTTSSNNYPTTVGAYDNSFGGGDTSNLARGIFVNYTHGSDIVVSRLSADGTAMLASTYVGGSENDGLNLNTDLVANYADQMRGEIILDEFQNVVIGSSTASSDFPTTPGAYQNTYGGGEQDGVVFKMDENLSGLIWSSFYGGDDADGIYSVIKSNSNDVYVAGGTKSDDLVFPSDAFQTTYQGGITDGFYAKISNDGNALLKGSYYGSDQYDQIYFVREDRFDQVYFYGQSDKFGSYWIRNATYGTPNSGQFISKMLPSQTDLEWSTSFGSGDSKINISPTAFLVDLCNKVYLSGWGSDDGGFDMIGGNIANGTAGMEVTLDAFKPTTDGHDFYLMVLEDDASELVYGSFYGGNLSEEHVDGGTSRFDEKGVMYQSVCAGCGGNNDFPIEPVDAVSSTNNGSWFGSPGCNNGVFKFDFGLPTIVADFDPPPVICPSESVDFVNKSKVLDETTYLWNFGDGTESTEENPTHTYLVAGHYEVELKIYDPASCNLYDSVTQTVFVMGRTLDDLASDSSCAGKNTQIGIPPYPDPTITYSWSPTIGLSDPSVSNPLVDIDVETEYTLIISNGDCFDTLKQTVVPFVFNYLVEDGVGCADAAYGTLFNGYGNFEQFLWSSNDLFGDTLNDFPSDSTLVDFDLAIGYTTYYVEAFDANGCEVIDSLKIWGVGSAYEGYIDTICIGDTVVFSDSTLRDLVIEYIWEPDDSVLFTSTDSMWAVPSVTQDFQLVKRYGLRCTDTMNFTVNVINNDPIEIPDTIVCNEETITLLGDPNDIYNPIYWFADSLLSDTVSKIRNLELNPIVGVDTFYIEYTDTFGCRYYKDVFVNNLDFQIETTGDSIACNKTFPTVEVTNYDPLVMVDLYWESTSEFTSDSLNPVTSIEAEDFYNRVWATVTNTNGCVASDTVIILNLAIEDYVLPPLDICEGDEAVIGIPFDESSEGLFVWIPATGLSDDSIPDPLLTGVDTATYGLIIDNGSCRDTIYQTINVSQIELEAFGDTSFCNILPELSFSNETKPGLTNFWSSSIEFLDTLQFGVDSNNLDIQSELGENTIYVKVYDEVGCERIDSVVVNAFEYDLTFTNNLEACGNMYLASTPIGYEDYDSVEFNWGPSPVLLTNPTDTNALFYGPAGSYSVPVTSTSAYGCTDTDYVELTFAAFDTTNIDLITSKDTLINRETAVLTASPSGLNYQWEPNQYVLSQEGNQATVSIVEPTEFTVTVTDPVLSQCNNQQVIRIAHVEIECLDPYIYVPNAFTPNGDGENDVLYVRGRNITDLYFAVFNRWGEKVFETTDQSVGWDGYFRGRSADPAVFDYYLKYLCEGEQEFFQKGNVTLIR